MNVKFETIVLQKKGSIQTLIFNRPKELNTITFQLMDEVSNALKLITKDEETIVLIVTGRDKSFMAGADLKIVKESNYLQIRNYLGSIQDMLTQIEDLEIPVIAAINGHAMGGGFELICSCDFRVMSESAVLGFPEIKLGSFPGASATSRLLRSVGQSKAAEIIMLGNNLTAKDALNLNLVNKVVPYGEVQASAFELAQELAKYPPVALKLAKKALNLGYDTDVKNARRYALEAMALLASTNDMREGLNAFFEKRQPVFKGN